MKSINCQTSYFELRKDARRKLLRTVFAVSSILLLSSIFTTQCSAVTIHLDAFNFQPFPNLPNGQSANTWCVKEKATWYTTPNYWGYESCTKYTFCASHTTPDGTATISIATDNPNNPETKVIYDANDHGSPYDCYVVGNGYYYSVAGGGTWQVTSNHAAVQVAPN